MIGLTKDHTCLFVTRDRHKHLKQHNLENQCTDKCKTLRI